MAIEKAIELDTGVNLSLAYIKINRISFSFDPSSVEVVVVIYKDKDAYNTSKLAINARRFICEGDDFNTYFSESVLNSEGKNQLSQAYVWLNTLSDL